MWTCPKCKRPFKRKWQQHSCNVVAIETLFEKRPLVLKLLYERIEKELKKFGEWQEEAVKPDTIYFKTKSSFAGIKIKKDHLVVEYFLDYVEDVFPVFKYLQTSKYRVAHMVVVASEKDITAQLIGRMKYSYELIEK